MPGYRKIHLGIIDLVTLVSPGDAMDLSAFRNHSKLRSSSHGHKRFSAWFHGRSVVGSEGSQSLRRSPKGRQVNNRSTSPNASMGYSAFSGIRSPSSTRSIIDPSSSPNIGSDSSSPSLFSRTWREGTRSSDSLTYDGHHNLRASEGTRIRTRLALSRPKPKPKGNKQQALCFPHIQNRKLKRKVIGCLVSGALLTVVLTTCKSLTFMTSMSPSLIIVDIALAISKSAAGESFHAILIMLILLLTIVFCHYLIRLLMLAMLSKHRSPSGDLVDQSRAGAIARPREPIRVILARDEELGLHDNNMVEEDKEIAIPPPPPAYGLWRCSVVSLASTNPC